MDKETLFSWRTAVLISQFLLVWTIARANESPYWWLVFVFTVIWLVSGAIKNGRW